MQLDFIENHFDPTLFARAEQALSSDPDYAIEKTGRNVYTISVDENTISLRYKEGLVDQISCTCDTNEKSQCLHIVEALILFRRHRPFESIKKAKSKRVRVKDILKTINKADLDRFVAFYARKDKSFAIVLKSHFASQSEASGNGDNYKLILSEIIPPKTARHPKVTQGSLKTIKIVLEDFNFQMHDCLSTENYFDASFIIVHTLDKIAYLQATYDIQDRKIEELRIDFLDAMDHILGIDLAPSFRSKIEKLLIENIYKSYYIPRDDNLIDVLISRKALTSADVRSQIRNLEKKYLGHPGKLPILCAILTIGQSFPTETFRTVIKLDAKNYFPAFKRMIEKGKEHIVQTYAEQIHGLGNDEGRFILCYYYSTKKDFDNLKETMVHLSPGTSSMEELTQLLESIGPEFLEQNFDDLEAWISGLPFLLKARYWMAARRFDLLLDAIESFNDAEWLMFYDKDLIDNGLESKVLKLYLSLVTDYLEEHYGDKSIGFLNEIFGHLKKIGAKTIQKEIISTIATKFPDRKRMNSYISNQQLT